MHRLYVRRVVNFIYRINRYTEETVNAKTFKYIWEVKGGNKLLDKYVLLRGFFLEET